MVIRILGPEAVVNYIVMASSLVSFLSDIMLRAECGGPPTTTYRKPRILKLRSRYIDHCLGQRATKAIVGGCLMAVYLVGVVSWPHIS
jgi:hypothetical protein